MINNFLIEMKNDHFFKSRVYSLEVDGVNYGILSFLNSKKFISLEKGEHTVKIKCDDYLFEDLSIVKSGQLQRFYLKPETSVDLLKGVSIGFLTLSLCMLLYSYFFQNTTATIPISLVLILSCSSLFFNYNKKDIKNFSIQK
jgi:hypothetical protein